MPLAVRHPSRTQRAILSAQHEYVPPFALVTSHSSLFLPQWLNDSLGEFDIVIRTHPFRAAFLVVLSMVVFFLVVKRWFGEDFAEPADYRNGGGNFRKRRLD